MIVEWHCRSRRYDYTIKLFYGMTGKRGYLIEVAKIKAGFKVTARLGYVRPANVLADGLQAASDDAKDPPTTRDLVIDIEWGRPHPANIPHPRQRPLQQPTHRHVRHRGGITTTCPIRDLVHGRDILHSARLLPSAVRNQGGNRNDVCLVCVRVSSRQDEAVYTEMLEAVIAKFTALGFNTDPTVVITDFERAATSAVEFVLGGHVHKQGCFFHLTQCTWRKIQELGLV